jgi:16S rRNA C967 or C1407 C5-methylase (RsmB/RsmF family)
VKKSTKKTNKDMTGEMKFNTFFGAVYQERWPILKAAMKIAEKQVARSCFDATGHEPEIQWLKGCFWYDNKSNFGIDRETNEQGKRKFYILNPASVLAARALKINPEDTVLDMCASPGGKTLILAESMTDKGLLWANEISMNRRSKLTAVIRNYVPDNLRDSIFTKGKDGLKYGISHENEFDKILIDAPCSGERHLLASSEHIAKWSEKRTKRLSTTQYGLVCSGLLALKPGGSLVYSTCSISPYENDGVIERLLLKKANSFELDLPEKPSPFAERTKFGWAHLPDKCDFGPIYFTRLKKKL